MSEPTLTTEQIRAIVEAASQALGADLYTGDTPGMRAVLLMHDLFAACLADLPGADQSIGLNIEHADQTVALRASDAARAAITEKYPPATWYAIFVELER